MGVKLQMCFKGIVSINLYTFQKLALFIAIMLALCPWIIAIVESNEGLFSSKINTKKPVYYCVNNGNERITTILILQQFIINLMRHLLPRHLYIINLPLQLYNLSVYDQIQ